MEANHSDLCVADAASDGGDHTDGAHGHMCSSHEYHLPWGGRRWGRAVESCEHLVWFHHLVRGCQVDAGGWPATLSSGLVWQHLATTMSPPD